MADGPRLHGVRKPRCDAAVSLRTHGCAGLPRVTAPSQGTTREPETRLVAYDTLGPARPNHHQLSGLAGRWLLGRVRGTLVEAGWGAELGCPALDVDNEGPGLEGV